MLTCKQKYKQLLVIKTNKSNSKHLFINLQVNIYALT